MWAFIKTETPVAQPSGLAPKQVEDKLSMLQDMHAKGMITEAELQVQRADVLRQATPAPMKPDRKPNVIDRFISLSLYGRDEKA